MDTKRLEQIGETFITTKLLETGIILPAKPFFDCSGADLVGFTSLDDSGRFCRIQCKYRKLINRTSIEVDKSYVVGAFVLFLYLKTGEEHRLYCFLPEEIQQIFRLRAKGSKNVFRLGITHKTPASLVDYEWTGSGEEKSTAICALMKASSPDAELRRLLVGLVEKVRRRTALERKRDQLQKLLHQIQMVTIEKKAWEEKAKISEEYAGILKKFPGAQRQRSDS